MDKQVDVVVWTWNRFRAEMVQGYAASVAFKALRSMLQPGGAAINVEGAVAIPLNRQQVLCLAVGIALIAPNGARAVSVWCSLEDGAGKRGFVSEVRQFDSARHAQRLSSRFRRTVNSTYGTSFSVDTGVCRQFPTHAAAERGLNAVRSDMLLRQLEILVVGIF